MSQILRFNTAYASDTLSAVIITAEYASAYSEKDFNFYPSISFPMSACFEYQAGKFQYCLNTNHILFEKGQTEFTVSKYPLFNKDTTLSIQFLKPDAEPDVFISKLKDHVVVQRRNIAVEFLLRRFLSIAFNKDQSYKEQLLTDILNSVMCDDDKIKTTRTNPYNTKQVDEAKDFIHAHYHEDLSITDIASVACLSTFYFSRLFRQATGYSPYDYLRLTRIENAKSLLDKGVSVTQTAFSSGFNSLENFSYAFSKTTGYSPTDFKKGKISKVLPAPFQFL